MWVDHKLMWLRFNANAVKTDIVTDNYKCFYIFLARCGEKSTVCHISKGNSPFSTSYGQRNLKLNSDSFLYMKFEDGDRKAIITYICDKTAKPGSPQLVSKSSEKTIFFVWRTEHACEHAVSSMSFSLSLC